MATPTFEKKVFFDFEGKPSSVNVRFFGPRRQGTLLALHGLATQGYCFDNLAMLVREPLIAIDWYGYGDSDRRLSKDDTYSAQICADWLLAATRALQDHGMLTRDFDVLAMSMSALPVALDYEKLSIRKIVFIHPAGLDTKINRKLSFGLSSGILSDTVLKIVTLPIVWRLLWKWSTIRSSDERRRYIRSDVVEQKGEFEVLRRYSKSGFDSWGHMRSTHYIPEHFKKINCPVLLLYGNDTVFYKRKYVEFGIHAGWKIVFIESAPHNMVRSHAEQIAGPINDFLGKNMI